MKIRSSGGNPQRFAFYNFIAESYNEHFFEGKEFLRSVINYSINPEFHDTWKDSFGTPIIFDGHIVRREGQKYKAIKISNFQQVFRLKKGNYENINVGQTVKVRLHFYLYGIIGEIVN